MLSRAIFSPQIHLKTPISPRSKRGNLGKKMLGVQEEKDIHRQRCPTIGSTTDRASLSLYFLKKEGGIQMVQVLSSIIIHRPLEDVFNFVNDFAAYPQWQHGVKEVKIVSQGPLGRGTQVVETRQFFGRTMHVSSVVTEFQPPYTRGFQMKGPFPSTGSMTFESCLEGTRLQIQMEMNGRGLFKFLVPLLGQTIQRQNATDFATLKKLLEANEESQKENRFSQERG